MADSAKSRTGRLTMLPDLLDAPAIDKRAVREKLAKQVLEEYQRMTRAVEERWQKGRAARERARYASRRGQEARPKHDTDPPLPPREKGYRLADLWAEQAKRTETIGEAMAEVMRYPHPVAPEMAERAKRKAPLNVNDAEVEDALRTRLGLAAEWKKLDQEIEQRKRTLQRVTGAATKRQALGLVRNEAVWKLALLGLPAAEIGRKLGISRMRVYQVTAGRVAAFPRAAKVRRIKAP